MFKIDEYIETQTPKTAEILIQLRHFIISSHPKMVETWKFKTPFYVYKGMFCYLSIEKKSNSVYVGFCDGHLMANESLLLEGIEKRMIRKFYVREKLSESKAENLMQLLQEAIIIKDTLQPKFTPPNKTKKA